MIQEIAHDEVYKKLKSNGAEGWGGSKEESRQQSWTNQFQKIFNKIELKGKRVLELGSGAGDASIVLAKQGFVVTGVEFSETAVQWAKEKAEKLNLDIRFIYGDVTQENLLSGETFDFILDGNCLHCLFDEQRPNFYKNVKRLMDNDGYFYIGSVIKRNPDDEIVKVGPIDRCFILEEELIDEISVSGLYLKEHWVNEHAKHSHFCGIVSK